jgi:hypothetical protein
MGDATIKTLLNSKNLHSKFFNMIKLRLKKQGKKREASYRLVACQSTSRRDGRPTDTVARLLVQANILAASAIKKVPAAKAAPAAE